MTDTNQTSDSKTDNEQSWPPTPTSSSVAPTAKAQPDYLIYRAYASLVCFSIGLVLLLLHRAGNIALVALALGVINGFQGRAYWAGRIGLILSLLLSIADIAGLIKS
jgi:hypothetical protein